MAQEKPMDDRLLCVSGMGGCPPFFPVLIAAGLLSAIVALAVVLECFCWEVRNDGVGTVVYDYRKPSFALVEYPAFVLGPAPILLGAMFAVVTFIGSYISGLLAVRYLKGRVWPVLLSLVGAAAANFMTVLVFKFVWEQWLMVPPP
jgi:hypothetical protein